MNVSELKTKLRPAPARYARRRDPPCACQALMSQSWMQRARRAIAGRQRSAVGRRCCARLHGDLSTAAHFLGRDVLDMRRYGPQVAERILERTRAIAVELVRHRAL